MLRLITVLMLFALTSAAPAADEPNKAKDVTSQTKHTITLDGKKIEYEATAGTMVLKEEDGKPQASVFYMSYIKTGEDALKRPITFCFNGGPGSSSVWLHMGAFGPRRVAFTDDGQPLPPPAALRPTLRFFPDCQGASACRDRSTRPRSPPGARRTTACLPPAAAAPSAQ